LRRQRAENQTIGENADRDRQTAPRAGKDGERIEKAVGRTAWEGS
jgi:hypothetical protein